MLRRLRAGALGGRQLFSLSRLDSSPLIAGIDLCATQRVCALGLSNFPFDPALVALVQKILEEAL